MESKDTSKVNAAKTANVDYKAIMEKDNNPVTTKHIIKLKYSFNENLFAIVNRDVLTQRVPPIGSGKTAVNRMLINTKLINSVMPFVLNISPTSSDVNWRDVVKDYFDSFTLYIPDHGKDFDLGFTYSLSDPDRADDIYKLASANNIKSSKELMEFVEGTKGNRLNVHMEKRYMYGKPNNHEDYINYVYCMGYPAIANSPADAIGKSKSVLYYFEDPDEAVKRNKEVSALRTLAMTEFVKLITNPDKVDNIIYSMFGTMNNFKDDSDKHLYLQQMVTKRPKEFLSIIKDKSIDTKAIIKQLITINILSESDSNVIFETANPSTVIGNSMDEAIAYFNAAGNKDRVIKYKHSLKK